MTQEGRSRFIRRLVRERFQSNPLAQMAAEDAGQDIDSLPEFMVISTPDASLVMIAESFVGGQQKGLNSEQIIEQIHTLAKRTMEATSPFPFPPFPRPIDLYGMRVTPNIRAQAQPLETAP